VTPKLVAKFEHLRRANSDIAALIPHVSAYAAQGIFVISKWYIKYTEF